MPSISSAASLPYVVHVYDNNGAFKRLSVPLVNFPAFARSLNTGTQPVELDFSTNDTTAKAPVQGDILTLTEQGGDGSVVFRGIVHNPVVQIAGEQLEIKLHVAPLVQELGETPFNTNYTVATDTGQIMRDAVNSTKHWTATTAEIPNTGITAIADFSNANVLKVLDEARRLTGPFCWWRADDTTQKVYVGTANPAGVAADYTVRLSQEVVAETYQSPFDNLLNFIPIIGGIPSGATRPIVSVYDNGHILHANVSGNPVPNPVWAPSSTYGVKAHTQPLTYSNVTDQTTLDNLATTLGQQFNRLTKIYRLEITGYAQRIQVGKVIRLWEPNTFGSVQAYAGTGTFGPNLVVMDVESQGPTQKVTASDMPVSIQDFQIILDRMAGSTAVASTTSISPGMPSVITPPMVGSGAPGIPAGLGLTTGIDNIAQVNNAYVVASWTANPGSDYISQYEVRWRKSADASFTYSHTTNNSFKIQNLLQGVTYLVAVRAINLLGIPSAFTAESSLAASTDSTPPAVPTGLAAIKTPRGALVAWTGNTEQDLKGYDLQVSIGGGAYSTVFTSTLATSFAYVAPSGTALGSGLTFQVRGVDWSGNFSAWSTASASVATDGVVFDEILAGNMRVFGTLTTGGLQTASSGARATLDSAGFKVFDGTATDWGAGAGIVFKADNTGNVFAKGSIASSTIYGSTVATSSTIGNTGSGSGYKLAGQWLDLYSKGVTSEGTRYWYAPDDVTAFVIAGQLAAASSVFAGPVTKTVLQLANFTGLEAITTDNTLGRGFISTQYSADGNGGILSFRKARGTPGSPGAVISGDTLGAIFPQAYDGTNWINPGLIGWQVTGAVSAGVVNTNLVISNGGGGKWTLTSVGHWRASGGAVPTLSSLRAGVSSQSIAGVDTVFNATVTTTGAGIAFTASAVGVNYGTQYEFIPKHALTLANPSGTAVGPFLVSDTTTFMDIGVLNSVPSGCTQNYNAIQLENS